MSQFRCAARCLTWLLIAAGLTACGDGPGKHGHVFAMVNHDATIASMNVKNLGMPTTPATLQTYQIKTGSRQVTWTTTGAVNYETFLDFEPHPGGNGTEACIMVIFCTTKQGDDGADRTFLLEFSGSNVTISEINSVSYGSQY